MSLLSLSLVLEIVFRRKDERGARAQGARENKKQEGNGGSIVLMGSPTRAEARVNSMKCGVYRIVNRH